MESLKTSLALGVALPGCRCGCDSNGRSFSYSIVKQQTQVARRRPVFTPAPGLAGLLSLASLKEGVRNTGRRPRPRLPYACRIRAIRMPTRRHTAMVQPIAELNRTTNEAFACVPHAPD
jgi:hypothetical protein